MGYVELCQRLAGVKREIERQDAVAKALLEQLGGADPLLRVQLGDDFRTQWSALVDQLESASSGSRGAMPRGPSLVRV